MELDGITIRWATPSEWKPVMLMIWKVYMEFDGRDASEEGRNTFFGFLSSDTLYQAFLRGRYPLMVAECGGRIVGAGSLRNGNLLSLLFVEKAFQGRGIGGELVERLGRHIMKYTEHKEMQVMASPNAVGFYEKLGFTAEGPEETVLGIRKTDMKKILLVENGEE